MSRTLIQQALRPRYDGARHDRAGPRWTAGARGSLASTELLALPESLAALARIASARSDVGGSLDRSLALRVERLHATLAELTALVETGAGMQASPRLPAFDADEERSAELLLQLLALSDALGLRLAEAASAKLGTAG